MNKTLFLSVVLAAMFASDVCVGQSGNVRGRKVEKEECEEMALAVSTNPRASGSGISSREAIAFNIAKLQARNELAAQIAVEVMSVIEHRAEQWLQTAGAGTDFQVNTGDYSGHVQSTDNSPRSVSGVMEHDSMVIVQKVKQILSNTHPICQNTYERPDGSVQVYVCMEMGLATQRQTYTALEAAGVLDMDVDKDGDTDVDFDEKEFLLELAKAREEYNNKKNEER